MSVFVTWIFAAGCTRPNTAQQAQALGLHGFPFQQDCGVYCGGYPI